MLFKLTNIQVVKLFLKIRLMALSKKKKKKNFYFDERNMILENPHICKIVKPVKSTAKTHYTGRIEYLGRLEHILCSTYRHFR